MDQFDPSTCTIKLHSEHHIITEHDVKKLMGLVDDNSEVEDKYSMDNMGVVKIKYHTDCKGLSISDLHNLLHTKREGDDNLEVLFTLFIMGTILSLN